MPGQLAIVSLGPTMHNVQFVRDDRIVLKTGELLTGRVEIW
jgi:hypothetical protein